MKAIKAERALLGMTQEELAKEFGVSRETVVRWESGYQLPPSHVLIDLADKFGCSVDYLLGRTKDRLPR